MTLYSVAGEANFTNFKYINEKFCVKLEVGSLGLAYTFF